MTRCNKCDFDNLPSTNFCSNCGTVIQEAAPLRTVSIEELLARSPNPDNAQDIRGETTPLRPVEGFQRTRGEASGQRRIVTVLIAEISSHTSGLGQISNEDLGEIVQQNIKALIHEVYKYEGIVDSLTSDGLVAFYGAPIYFENNAERAVRSALDLQDAMADLNQTARERLGLELNLRIGLHAGEMIIGRVGSDLRMVYTDVGNTIRLARILVSAALPGAILASEAVQLQTRALVEYEAGSAQALQGNGQPISAFCVQGLKSQPRSRGGIEGLHAPMIGRDAELATLQQAVNALVDRKTGSLVVLTGEPGIGKSRLTHEFKALAALKGARILEGSSLAYRRTLSYWIILDLLRSFLRISYDSSDEDQAARLAQLARETLHERADEALPYLEHLFSFKPSDPNFTERLHFMDSGQLRQNTFLAVRNLLVAEANRQPLLLILEDLHWADDASLELLLFLVEAVRQSPMMIYAISRSNQGGYLGTLAKWSEHKIPDHYHALHLQSLSPFQSSQLLYQLLTTSHLPESLQHQILEKSGGVPFTWKRFCAC